MVRGTDKMDNKCKYKVDLPNAEGCLCMFLLNFINVG